MKELKTIHGETIIVDDDDYEKAKQFRWRLHFYKKGKFQVETAPRAQDDLTKKISYKNLILGLESKITLFKNENPFDLRKENLLVFDSQGEFSKYNANNYYQNRSADDRFKEAKSKQGKGRKRLGKTTYLGAQYEPNKPRPWKAKIVMKNQKYHLGSYTKDEHAAVAYDIKAIELYGIEAKRNFPHLSLEELCEQLALIKEKDTVDFQEHTSKCHQGLLYQRTKASQYVGVCLHENPEKKWASKIRCRDKIYWIGTFYEEIDAAIAYDKKAIELFGPEAKRNFPHLSITQLSNLKDKDEIDYDILSKINQGKLRNVPKTSKYVGVYLVKNGKWSAQIRQNPIRYYLGTFDNEDDAARAYDEKALELYGENAKLNFPR
jgi:hypothetical protein